MSHGGGGTMTQGLIDELFKKHFKNGLLMKGEDSAVFELSGQVGLHDGQLSSCSRSSSPAATSANWRFAAP